MSSEADPVTLLARLLLYMAAMEKQADSGEMKNRGGTRMNYRQPTIEDQVLAVICIIVFVIIPLVLMFIVPLFEK